MVDLVVLSALSPVSFLILESNNETSHAATTGAAPGNQFVVEPAGSNWIYGSIDGDDDDDETMP